MGPLSVDNPCETQNHDGPELTRTRGIGPTKQFGRPGLLVATGAALVVAFIQAPGSIIDDTKLSLDVTPLTYMANSLHLWKPSLSGGTLGAADFGYLFPMGPFFGAGQALHLPVWITERLWLALLLTTAFWGVVRLGEALEIGNRPGRVVGAMAYTIAPLVVTWATSTAALLSIALLPWVVVPLVRGAAGGSPRRAAAASGVAIALMGGVNATVVLAVLPVPLIWLLTRERGPRRRALIRWWILAGFLACFWWLAALFVQSRYGYNYLPYTETSRVTTATSSLFEAVRGASFWTGYLTLGGPLFPGTWELISSVVPLVGTVIVAALGLAGLARRGIPERLFLVTSLLCGVLFIAIGYGGATSGPAAHSVQTLLQGPLALLRNVGKFSPDVALPLALGLTWFLSSLRWDLLANHAWRGGHHLVAVLHLSAVAIVVGALVAASAPFWQAKLYPPGGFSSIPSYWKTTAQWLNHRQAQGAALVVPGAEFARYTWGYTLDEPLSVYLRGSWNVRSLVPLGSNGNDQVLDAVETSLDQGVVAPGMAAYLARAGFDYVVVRNDLNIAATGAPPPAQVHQVLAETPGLKEVAGFGPEIPLSQATDSRLSVYDSLTADRHLRSVEVFRVTPYRSVVRTYPARDPVVMSGSPASLLPSLASGVLTHRAAVLAGDPDGGAIAARAPAATWAQTDGNQRRDQSFGLIRNNLSYVLGPTQRTSLAVPGVPQNLAVVPGVTHQTVADPVGAASVSSSSYGSTALSLVPAEGPAAAFSANPANAWVASNVHDSKGQWVQINFGRSIKLRTIKVHPLTDSPARPRVTEITISTARGSVRRRVTAGVNTLAVPRGSSKWLRITLTDVRPVSPTFVKKLPLGAGLTGVTIPGVTFRPALRLPSDEASAFASGSSKNVVYTFSAPLTNANLDLGAPQDQDPQMIRRFTVPKGASVSIAGAATPLPGAALSSLLPKPHSYVTVVATSTLGNLPRFNPDNLITKSGRPWIANLGDGSPALTFTWLGKRTVGSIVLTPTPQASTPRQLVISSPSGRAVVDVPRKGGVISFPPMVTNTLTITFVNVAGKLARLPSDGAKFIVPVGVQQLRIPGLGSSSATSPLAPFVLPCGEGPTIRVDDTVLQTTLSGTVSDVEALRPLELSVCHAALPLGRGEHLLQAGSADSAFKITSLFMTSGTSQSTHATRSTRIVGAWTALHRTVHVDAGSAAYLVVAQNYNRGWKATLDGHTLTPLRVDGWQQAWVVPSGSGGTVTMQYTPETEYGGGLIVGALLLVLLFLFALVRRGQRDAPPSPTRRPLPLLVVAGLGLIALVLVVGPVALVLLPLLAIGLWWGPDVLACVAGGAFLAGGLVAAWSPGAQPVSGLGAFSPFAQTCTAVALGAVIASLAVANRTAMLRRGRASSRSTCDSSKDGTIDGSEAKNLPTATTGPLVHGPDPHEARIESRS
jgi:arabinofuranan 3-O-arabinosyltransferase